MSKTNILNCIVYLARKERWHFIKIRVLLIILLARMFPHRISKNTFKDRNWFQSNLALQGSSTVLQSLWIFYFSELTSLFKVRVKSISRHYTFSLFLVDSHPFSIPIYIHFNKSPAFISLVLASPRIFFEQSTIQFCFILQVSLMVRFLS